MGWVEDLDKLLVKGNLTVKFGLRAQGHLPTILDALDAQKSWTEIGALIGWDPETAREWFRREVLREP